MKRLILVLAAAMIASLASAAASPQQAVAANGLSSTQRAGLRAIARDTWRFYAADVDPSTALPMDNVTFAGGATTPTGYGRYTSASNIGVYLWAVVAAYDLELIGRPEARARIQATLGEV